MNLESVLEQLAIPFKRAGESPHVSAGWVGIECPYCGIGTGKYGMGLNLSSFAVNCWKCGKHRLFSTLRICARIDERTLGETLRGLKPDRPAERTLGPSKAVLPPGVGPLLGFHRKFIQERGLDPTEVIETWRIQGIGQSSTRYAWSLFIPAILDDEVVSWTTRSIGSQKRYDSAPSTCEKIPIKEMLYGEHLAGNAVIVCEGPIDAWAIGPGGVATCGVAITDAQIIRIAKYPLRVICFDRELEAQRRAEEVCRMLAPFPGQTLNLELSGKDASRSPKKEIYQVRKRFLE